MVPVLALSSVHCEIHLETIGIVPVSAGEILPALNSFSVLDRANIFFFKLRSERTIKSPSVLDNFMSHIANFDNYKTYSTHCANLLYVAIFVG